MSKLLSHSRIELFLQSALFFGPSATTSPQETSVLAATPGWEEQAEAKLAALREKMNPLSLQLLADTFEDQTLGAKLLAARVQELKGMAAKAAKAAVVAAESVKLEPETKRARNDDVS